jgi:2,3-dihydroxyphenylpropionate 1,2-dioxygenase
MSSALVCASHSPLMYCWARAPDCHATVEQLFLTRAAEIRVWDPQLVIIFGPDHFNGFFLRLMPAFCAGTRCTAVGDIGGFAGALDVPMDESLALVAAARAADVDLSVSYRMSVDHGFSQVLHRLLGGLDAYPTIPIFINGIAPPFVPFRRSRLLGAAVGRYASALGKRVLFIASGGMSHNPTRYYPDIGTGTAAVTDWQMQGDLATHMTNAQWLHRLDAMHREGADMLVQGLRTRADLKLNPQMDGQFLDIISSGELDLADALDPADMVAQAGIGFLELHTWLAAAAAHQAAGGLPPGVDLYAEALEYGIAFGMVHSQPR